ncbi:hypothetical protein ABTM36_20305, partial [Acinetobacter baumannii]
MFVSIQGISDTDFLGLRDRWGRMVLRWASAAPLSPLLVDHAGGAIEFVPRLGREHFLDGAFADQSVTAI